MCCGTRLRCWPGRTRNRGWRGRIGRADRVQRDRLAFDDGLGHRHRRGDRHLRRDIGQREAVVAIDAQLAAIDEQHGDVEVLRRRAVRERVEDPAQRRRLIEAPHDRQDSRDRVGHVLIVRPENRFAIGYWLSAIGAFAIGDWALIGMASLIVQRNPRNNQ